MLKIDNYSSDILKNISFCLENKNLIILGSNGAGKTTLAKVLCGLIPNDNVFINNINPSSTYGEEKTKLINYIPAKLDIFDEFMTVYEFLSLNILYSNISIDEVLDLLDISYLKDKSCKILSSGESQLLLLGSAILHGAVYTILDEPTSNLDPKKVKKVYKILQDNNLFQNKIIITHNLNLAYKLGYDILYIKDNKMVFHDTGAVFFDEDNLYKFFDSSVKKIDDNILVNL